MIVIDARGWEPPRPFQAVMETLCDLKPGEKVRLIVEREPASSVSGPASGMATPTSRPPNRASSRSTSARGRPPEPQPACRRSRSRSSTRTRRPCTSIRPTAVRSCRIREKCSCVRFRRDATTPLATGSSSSSAPVAFAEPLPPQSRSRNPISRSVPDRVEVRLDVGHELVQPARQAAEHAPGELRIVVDPLEHDFLRHGQQERVDQRLRRHDMRRSRETSPPRRSSGRPGRCRPPSPFRSARRTRASSGHKRPGTWRSPHLRDGTACGPERPARAGHRLQWPRAVRRSVHETAGHSREEVPGRRRS